jgi:hypothetical protein
MTPTESAQSDFKNGRSQVLQNSGETIVVPGLWPVFMTLFNGLDNMSVALRAIYIKLEEIEKELKRVSNQTRSKTPF